MMAEDSMASLEVNTKYSRARILDRYFDPDNYVWVLGYAAWNALWGSTQIQQPPCDESAAIMGIRVQFDVDNPFKVKLFKEIK